MGVTLVLLAPAFAKRVVEGPWTCLHSVVLALRTDRKRFLVPDEPGKKKLAKLTHCFGVRPSSAQWNAHGLVNCKAAGLILDWVRVSLDLKDFKKAVATTQSFARLFARTGSETAEEMMARLERVSTNTIRLARVRLDCTANLLRRIWFFNLIASGACANFYVFSDGSPDFRGMELFSSVMDVIINGEHSRLLLPMVSLARTQLDVIGKTFTLLWQFLLMFGPMPCLLRQVLQRTRAIITDFGTERKIATLVDCLPDFSSK